jgi:two-component system OmpR family sensor kinase
MAGRTAIILLIGFAAVQLLGLVIHTFNQISLARIEEEREVATRDVIIYRHIAFAKPTERAALVASEPVSNGAVVELHDQPLGQDETLPLPLPVRQMMRGSIIAFGIPQVIRPFGLEMRMMTRPMRYVVSFGVPDMPAAGPPPDGSPSNGPPPGGSPPDGMPPDGMPPGPPPDQSGIQLLLPPPLGEPFYHRPTGSTWLTIITPSNPPAPWRSPGFASAFIVMTALGALMIVWAVRHLTTPVRTLADAAERLGRDVINAPNLPEDGPSEIVTAAIAFNTMASRIRRFVQDRTFLLTAIGHDLRTPITRLKLRAEYMEDEEQRLKMLADLDEMESMVAATLAFGRDAASAEAVARMDLAVLLRTILDEAADGDPDHAASLSYSGPEHLAVQARPLSLKRALTNLIGNALKYGDAAAVSLEIPQPKQVQIHIDDQGPGIQADNLDTVFEPFRRLETSRNRESGGSGLGLSIARNIVRAHGGDITLANRSVKGLRATVTLPV